MEIDTGMQNLSPLGHQFKFSKPVTKNCYHMKVVCELCGISIMISVHFLLHKLHHKQGFWQSLKRDGKIKGARPSKLFTPGHDPFR